MSDEKQVTWGGRFSGGPSERMQAFSESVSFDTELAPFDIEGSRAQAAMLESIGILTAEERKAIDEGLVRILAEIEAGEFSWDPALEDVHMNIEQALSARVPAAAKLHTARSRNDQVATDTRLYLRWAVDEVDGSLVAVMRALVALAEESVDLLVPGYTHLQRGQPVSVAHHLLAYAEMFGRDRERFASLRERVNVCPLGSGALAGTTLPIDRKFVARELGFVDAAGNPRLTANSLDAVSDRDAPLEFCFNAALSGLHLSRFAEDFILWNSSEFGFVTLPDAFTTGSSLMPQKKNPDALELIRGKAARLQGNLVTLQAMVKNLPLTYNRDLQEDKPPLYDALGTWADSLEVMARMAPAIEFLTEPMRRALADGFVTATELADYLVTKGVPFREAHEVVGRLVAACVERGERLEALSAEALARHDPRIGPDALAWLDPEAAVERRDVPGGPARGRVEAALADAERRWAERTS